MNLLQRLEHWGNTHHPKWLDILRVCFGVFLCFKGIQFLNNMGRMMDLMANSMSFGSFTIFAIGHYVVFAHLMGGFLLAIGLLTRIACIIQIPVLLGAIIFINTAPEMMRPFSELFLSILVLLLLIFFLIVGSGPWSFNRYVDMQEKK